MNVIDNRTKEKPFKYFCNIPIGTVYADEKENICIKTDEAEFDVNCLTLRDGEWCAETESANEPVTVLKARLIIEN